MKQLSIREAQNATSPSPIALICTNKENGDANIATIAWWTYLSNSPAMLGFALSKTGYTGQRIQATREFVLSIPNQNLTQKALQCGTVSGRQINKPKAFSIDLQAMKNTGVLFPVDSKIVMRCRLSQIVETGATDFFICNILEVCGEEQGPHLYSVNDYCELIQI